MQRFIISYFTATDRTICMRKTELLKINLVQLEDARDRLYNIIHVVCVDQGTRSVH